MLGIYIILIAKLAHKLDPCVWRVRKYVNYDRQGVFIDGLTGHGEADMLDRHIGLAGLLVLET